MRNMSYIQTTQEWLYLATVIDLYSRKVVGWSIDENMKTSLILDALEMSITTRNPIISFWPWNTIYIQFF